jgi:DNA-binding protein YbaB
MVGRMRSQSRAELDAMLEEYRVLSGRIRRLREDLTSLTATRRSADGCARVTVNAWGELTRLTFDAAAARLDPPVLAARVEEAAGSAVAEVRRRKQALMSELLPPGLRDLVDHEGLGGLRGLVPEVDDLPAPVGERR